MNQVTQFDLSKNNIYFITKNLPRFYRENSQGIIIN